MPKPSHLLAMVMPEVTDFPLQRSLKIYMKGSLIGEEDIISRGEYSCTLKCYTQKASIFKMGKEYFRMLRSSDTSWLDVLAKVTYKEYRS